ncbi:Splicing factor 45 [Phytophthora boehmeriae]|uniref:Splicing factor 45 n=1 Tax=Phytophthora boehmeriae TaxID=109152 RepID=A0A8T1WM54_9STRA|nr:Splicing factor 45 [Phytophthora boehmeriae]
MDLYADLPLAKGAKTSSALDADGKPKAALSTKSSVWGSAPLMVPQAAKNKSNSRPTSVVASSTTMLPSALAAARAKSPSTGGISLAFKPASVTRKATPMSQVFQKKAEEKTQGQSQGQSQVQPRGAAFGLGFTTVTEVRVMSAQEQEKETVNNAATEPQGHFFQATYRDEYHPARPNSYEVYCKERTEKKKLEEVKRELSRRQREQEREGKREREKLAKDVAEGRAPTMQLPVSAGRGRGMTVPAWMRKKIEENAAVAQPESERDVDREHGPEKPELNVAATEGQFEDAAEPRGGLGFSNRGIGFSSSSSSSSSSTTFNGFTRPSMTKTDNSPHRREGNNSPSRHSSHNIALDEFGREIRRDSKQMQDHQQSGRQIGLDTSTGGYNKRSSERNRDNNRAFGEKRRRTSGWDSRAPTRTSSSRVVLLQNMVGPGEVDDELQDEVKGECAGKYGPVEKCLLYEVTGRVSPEEAVRIFVQFRNVEDATKALAGLNGRFFGGRKVKATYYNESKFERMDLTSQ